MGKHWHPEAQVLPVRRIGGNRRWTKIDGYWVEPKPRLLPPGAAVGLMLVALACFATALVYYQLWGPRDSFAQDSQIDWDSVQLVATVEPPSR